MGKTFWLIVLLLPLLMFFAQAKPFHSANETAEPEKKKTVPVSESEATRTNIEKLNTENQEPIDMKKLAD